MPRHPHPAHSTESLQGSVFQALSRRMQQHEGPLWPLHVGDTWREPPEAARAEAQVTAEHPGLHRYAMPQGEAALLEAIGERLGRVAEAPEAACVQVCSGATVGLSLAVQGLLDPGDELLLPSPYWPLIRGIVASRGAVPVEVPLWTRLDEPGFELEAALEAAVTERTAALYLNTPHNPTGRVLSGEQLAAAARVAERHDLWVFADQVYEELWYGEAPPPPPWTRGDLRERTVAVHSLSKSHGLAGARVGWLHGAAEAMTVLRRLQTYQVYCAARPMQVAGARALTECDDWLAEARAGYERAGRLAAEALGLPAPRGGNFLFFDASPWLDGGDDALPFLERCLDEGVVLTPGASCGADFRSWVRLCFTSVPEDELAEALEALRRVTG
jgi:N-succinyldiaminopimelate aminotransferase